MPPHARGQTPAHVAFGARAARPQTHGDRPFLCQALRISPGARGWHAGNTYRRGNHSTAPHARGWTIGGDVLHTIQQGSPACTGICRAERPTRRRIYPTPRAHGAQTGMTGALRRPARTGITPWLWRQGGERPRFPRTHGDKPYLRDLIHKYPGSAPRARGSSARLRSAAKTRKDFPARTGSKNGRHETRPDTT